ncbi:carboxypeptidase-like regulatory domain-containing protein [Pokkaliibacter sp. CJK22405]|uniref:carboxypeptidase-like regulatory domain-containing protein n=1 Tax=Pokkaliibacter sp. CJK22405 TaxID=3384615 RepID=UPI003984B5FF
MVNQIPPSSLVAVNTLQSIAKGSVLAGSSNTNSLGQNLVQAQVLTATASPSSGAATTGAAGYTRTGAAPTSQGQYQATVSVQGQVYKAVSNVPLTPGQTVTLKAIGPQLLQVVPTPSAAQQTLLSQLKTYLPQQQSLDQLQPLLQRLTLTPTALALSPQAYSAMQSIKQQLPKKDELKQPDTLKSAVQNSGFFTEKRLLKGESVSQDHKALLWQALQNLEPEHPMRKAVEGRLARIQVMQLENMQRDNEQHIELVMTSPQQELEPFRLRVKRDESGSSPEAPEQQQNWQIDLDFEIEDNEQIHIRLDYQQALGISLWLPDKSWDDTLSEPVSKSLINALQDKGIRVSNYQQFVGRPKEDDDIRPVNTLPLIDEKV